MTNVPQTSFRLRENRRHRLREKERERDGCKGISVHKCRLSDQSSNPPEYEVRKRRKEREEEGVKEISEKDTDIHLCI